MGDILGYARVSTQLQDLDAQKNRLLEVGAIKIFTDVISGKIFKRPGLDELIAYARPDDLICVVRLDRLGRSLKEWLCCANQKIDKLPFTPNFGLASAHRNGRSDF